MCLQDLELRFEARSPSPTLLPGRLVDLERTLHLDASLGPKARACRHTRMYDCELELLSLG